MNPYEFQENPGKGNLNKGHTVLLDKDAPSTPRPGEDDIVGVIGDVTPCKLYVSSDFKL
jgi:hypothetical protein